MSKENLIANYKGIEVEINYDKYYFPQSVSNHPGISVAYAIGIPLITAGMAATVYGLGSGINGITDYCLDMKYSPVRHTAIVIASGLMAAYALDLPSLLDNHQAEVAHDAFLFTASLVGQIVENTVEYIFG